MNRRYSIEEFAQGVELLRKAYNDVALTTDIIVGFPGETEDEFNATYDFLKKIKFYKMHIFKYSQRKGTRAAVMPNQVDGNIKEVRSRKLIALSDENEKEYNEKYIGKEVEVLFEEPHEENGVRYMKGHTTNYRVVKVATSENLENEVRKVKVTKIDKLELLAEEQSDLGRSLFVPI